MGSLGSVDRYGVGIHQGTYGNNDYCSGKTIEKKGNGCGCVYVWSHELAGTLDLEKLMALLGD
jgi:hypothetical protein